MNRTSRLMTAVTASLLLGGPVAANAAIPFLDNLPAPQSDNASKPDPQVDKAADTIYTWLKGSYEKDAKTQGEIEKQFPDLGSDLVAKALNQLCVDRKDLRRMGDGTQSNPYKYFEYCSSCG